MELLALFGIQQFYTDNWGASSRQLDAKQYTMGKTNTQKIGRKHLMLRMQNHPNFGLLATFGDPNFIGRGT